MSPLDGDRVGASRVLNVGIKRGQILRKQNAPLIVRLQPEADAYHRLNMSSIGGPAEAPEKLLRAENRIHLHCL